MSRSGHGALFVAAYVTLALLTFASPGLPEEVSIARLVWLPSGLALACIVMAGLRAWFWIFLAEALVTLVAGDPLLGALGTGAGSTAEAVLAAFLLGRIGFSSTLGRWRDVVALIVLGSGLSSLLGAAVSVGSLVLVGSFAPDAFWDILPRWWLTHTNGILLLAPVVLTAGTGLLGRVRARGVEAGGLAALLALVGGLLFSAPDSGALTRLLLYVPFPLLLWAALRFRLAGAAVANLILLLPAISGTVLGRGPLAGAGPTETVARMSIFLMVSVLTSLILAGVVEEREEAARARLAAEEERREMSERMHQAQKLESLGVLAGGIAHDFNNLLATIMGHADLAQRSVPQPHPAQENLSEVLRASRRAADLCRQILVYAGRGHVSAAAVDLNEVVDEMGELLSVSFPPNATVEIKLQRDLPPVWGDVTRLRQIVLNLLTNAADALPDGRGRITVSTGLVSPSDIVAQDVVTDAVPARGGALVHLTVEDDGVGMDPALRARVVEPFFSTKQAGRGLGLAVVQGIVRSHRGALEIRTVPGAGTRFRVSLPPTDRPVLPESTGAPVREVAGLRGHRLLLADDDEAVRFVCRTMLEEEGVEVVEVGDGAAAVTRFRQERSGFDLVLLDLAMPRMGGMEALAAIQEIDPGARVILTTGNPADSREVEAALGVPLLPKPYGSEELRTAVAAALGRPSAAAPE
ncbi:MAG: MASE1 domain-containing protein [Longimicrobiales bacterium]|nr:MASE1 domain-containing protein [Longimicrobiales bacterium]